MHAIGYETNREVLHQIGKDRHQYSNEGGEEPLEKDYCFRNAFGSSIPVSIIFTKIVFEENPRRPLIPGRVCVCSQDPRIKEIIENRLFVDLEHLFVKAKLEIPLEIYWYPRLRVWANDPNMLHIFYQYELKYFENKQAFYRFQQDKGEKIESDTEEREKEWCVVV